MAMMSRHADYSRKNNNLRSTWKPLGRSRQLTDQTQLPGIASNVDRFEMKMMR